MTVIRICAPKKRVEGTRIQAHRTGGRCINRALINRWGRMKGGGGEGGRQKVNRVTRLGS